MCVAVWVCVYGCDCCVLRLIFNLFLFVDFRFFSLFHFHLSIYTCNSLDLVARRGKKSRGKKSANTHFSRLLFSSENAFVCSHFTVLLYATEWQTKRGTCRITKQQHPAAGNIMYWCVVNWMSVRLKWKFIIIICTQRKYGELIACVCVFTCIRVALAGSMTSEGEKRSDIVAFTRSHRFY